VPRTENVASPWITGDASEGKEGGMYVIWWIIVGLIAGWATGKIMKGAGYGTLMDIGLGILGAIVGGMIVTSLGFPEASGLIPAILVAILGSVVIVCVARLLKRA
jgi:uncharacterized membrane protein YeaQ/YmgE (transglycosylase-associated protein family)